jgi:serine/threonine protein kinase
MSQQGTRIGPYALQTQVGRAAGCTVWHARRADGKARGPDQVAVRLLDDPGDAEAQARLELEYQRLKALDGAGAPQAMALYAGFGALVMDRKQGATLRAVLDASLAATLELDPATALEIALGGARVLRHAHQLPDGVLVHGRLSLADLLLGRDGTVTLLGWGGWSPQVWSPGVAPELMRGQAPTPQSDMFSLGAVLTTTLEPRLAQQGLAPAVQRIKRGWPAAGRLLENLLATEPAARYPDLGPVIHELLSLARHHGGVARIGEVAERCASFRRGSAVARGLLGATQAPVAPSPALPPITPPPVGPPPPAPRPPEPAPPAEPPSPSPSPSTEPIPVPVPPRPVAPAPSPAAPESPEPAPVVEAAPRPEEREPAPEAAELEKTEQLPPRHVAELMKDEEDDEVTNTDADGASMQLVERIALALVGLLGLAVLAWLGKACLGG